jgi:hypothetical protein
MEHWLSGRDGRKIHEEEKGYTILVSSICNSSNVKYNLDKKNVLSWRCAHSLDADEIKEGECAGHDCVCDTENAICFFTTMDNAKKHIQDLNEFYELSLNPEDCIYEATLIPGQYLLRGAVNFDCNDSIEYSTEKLLVGNPIAANAEALE